MATVTMPAERYKRLRRAANEWKEYVRHVDQSVSEREVCRRAGLQPGDLEPIEPDPEPSMEAMIDDLVEERREMVTIGGMMGSSGYVYAVESSGSSGRAPDWRTALRAAYAMVVGEEG